MPLSEVPRSQNKLLGALSAKCYKRLSPSLELVEFPLGKILYQQKQRIKDVYFPRWAAVSMVNIFEDGSMVEVGVVGREGVVGSFVLSGDDISPHQAIVQIGDGAWRMSGRRFQTRTRQQRRVKQSNPAILTSAVHSSSADRGLQSNPSDIRAAGSMAAVDARSDSVTDSAAHTRIHCDDAWSAARGRDAGGR